MEVDGEEKQEKQRKKKGLQSPDMDNGGKKSGELPPHLEFRRTRVLCKNDYPTYAQGTHYSGVYMSLGVDNSLNMEEFQKNLRVEVKKLTNEEMVFDLIGIDAAIANAFRRILIAEVPMMAIEKVYIANNTSIIQDEVLSHRLGLVPLKADPRRFDFKTDEELASEKNTIVFKLHVKCVRRGERVINSRVYSSELKWLPKGSEYPPEQKQKFTAFSASQEEKFADDPIQPFYSDIILAKLRPGQEIELEAHAVKGMGKTHAKWSPVATATYRMLPEVVLKEEIKGEMAEELVKKCPAKVFDIEDLPVKGEKRACVARPRDCTLCRECIREDGWGERIQLHRVKHHFIFSIESTGALPPNVLFTEAVKILSDKCERILSEIT
ncbi:hypothetical protein CBR_g51921 [Chara braunii]|uniref:DNA-directed RNA polymerases I and III subunit RPAC1 n=1 Tax=Chara braunii TaxID=69332 RepID=A0A388M969_CHABU|nr:hypothetical protein CBR_g51921 [Chara braunii]|eukprot:GBG91118.1 hypothetical protein CBR_g51921 [Chara braunii]